MFCMLFVGAGERKRALSNNLTYNPNWIDIGSCSILLVSHLNTMAIRAAELTRQLGQPAGHLHAFVGEKNDNFLAGLQ